MHRMRRKRSGQARSACIHEPTTGAIRPEKDGVGAGGERQKRRRTGASADADRALFHPLSRVPSSQAVPALRVTISLARRFDNEKCAG
jgi:hypothetical protein